MTDILPVLRVLGMLIMLFAFAMGVPLAAAPHLYLHAAMLTISHPRSGERMTFEAPAPFPV